MHDAVAERFTEQVVAVVHHGMSARDMLGRLMSREAKSERHGQA